MRRSGVLRLLEMGGKSRKDGRRCGDVWWLGRQLGRDRRMRGCMDLRREGLRLLWLLGRSLRLLLVVLGLLLLRLRLSMLLRLGLLRLCLLRLLDLSRLRRRLLIQTSRGSVGSARAQCRRKGNRRCEALLLLRLRLLLRLLLLLLLRWRGHRRFGGDSAWRACRCRDRFRLWCWLGSGRRRWCGSGSGDGRSCGSCRGFRLLSGLLDRCTGLRRWSDIKRNCVSFIRREQTQKHDKIE